MKKRLEGFPINHVNQPLMFVKPALKRSMLRTPLPHPISRMGQSGARSPSCSLSSSQFTTLPLQDIISKLSQCYPSPYPRLLPKPDLTHIPVVIKVIVLLLIRPVPVLLGPKLRGHEDSVLFLRHDVSERLLITVWLLSRSSR